MIKVFFYYNVNLYKKEKTNFQHLEARVLFYLNVRRKNMELINILYRYLNRYINSEELVELLENMDKTKFSPKEQEDLSKIN